MNLLIQGYTLLNFIWIFLSGFITKISILFQMELVSKAIPHNPCRTNTLFGSQFDALEQEQKHRDINLHFGYKR